MTETEPDTDTIARYLLGQLPEADSERLEARLLAEPGLFEAAEVVEDELIDRYARGEMDADQRARFESHLLGAERVRERVAFARALATRAGEHRQAPAAAGARVLPHRGRFGRGSVRLAWAAVLIFAIASGWMAWRTLELRSEVARLGSELTASRTATERARGRADDLEHAAARATTQRQDLREQLAAEHASSQERIAELEKRQLSGGELRVRRPVDKGKKVESALPQVSLLLGLTRRGEGDADVLRLGAARRVELDLDLGGQRPSAPVTATVSRQGEPVWSAPDLAVESVDGETVVRLDLPRESLSEGRYRVELRSAGTAGHLLGSYELQVRP